MPVPKRLCYLTQTHADRIPRCEIAAAHPNCGTQLAVSLAGDTTISNKNNRLQKNHGSLSPINDNPAVNLGERCFQLLDL